jgi:hypothetical protein
MLIQQSAFLTEMSNPFCEIELSGIRFPLPFPQLNACTSAQVQPLEAECITILDHVSVTRIVIHIPFPCEGSVLHLGLNPQSDPLSHDMDPQSYPSSNQQCVGDLYVTCTSHLILVARQDGQIT